MGAFRVFRSPLYAATTVLSLAIGIGANTVVFSVANALLLRPLPYPDAGRLAILWNRSPGLNIAEDWFSPAQYFDIRDSHRGFEQVAIAIGGNNNLTGYGAPERVGTIRVSSNLLPMLGARAALGRLLLPEDDRPGHAPVALLSHGLWQRRYGGDAAMVGRKILINGTPYEVAGVLDRGFALPHEVLPTLGGAEQGDILLPLPMSEAAIRNRANEDYNIVGKLKPGVSVASAQAEMDILTARLRHDFPDLYPPNGGLTFSIQPLQEQVVGDTRRPLYLLLGSVGLVLLIACANVANLSLSRAMGKRQEIAVRMALGATRWQITAHLLAESLGLAVAGGALGILLCQWTLSWIRALGPKSVPRIDSIGLDVTVLAFTLGVSMLSAVLFGLLPALRASSMDVHEALKDAGRSSSGAHSVWGGGYHLRRLLVAGELALSVVLLIGAGLLVRSFARLQEVRPGFNPANVLTLGLTMSGHKYDNRQVVLETYRQLWERLERLPGVRTAGGVSSLPLTDSFAWGPILVEGRTPPAGENFINVDIRMVSGRYFEAMEIPLLRGRLFNAQDTSTSPRVVIVDEFMAAQLWPGEDAIGKRIRNGAPNSKDPWETVVGVVGRVKQYTLDADSRIARYVPQSQFITPALSVVLRSNSDPAALTAAVKSEIQALDPDLPVYQVRTMQQRVDESLARRRFSMLLLGVFAGLALALAAIGTYGVMAYLVTQGTREIGIRMALGATPQAIAGMIVGSGARLAATGVTAGLLAASGLTGLMRTLLYGIGATDVLTFATVGAVLMAVALVASYVPARRASRVDPISSLRWE